MSTRIKGRVTKIFHVNGTYHVLGIHVEEHTGYGTSLGKNTTATGHLFGVQVMVGTHFELEGKIVKHPKYGMQLRIKTWHPWGAGFYDVRSFLTYSVPVFRDANLLQLAIDTVGLDLYKMLEEGNIAAIGRDEGETAALEEVQREWTLARGIANLAESLEEYKLGANVIAAVYLKFGLDAVDILQANPYRLIELDLAFKRADYIALNRGMSVSDPRRVAAAVLWSIRQQVKQQGHLFVRQGDLVGLMTSFGTQEGVPGFPTEGLEAVTQEALKTLEYNHAIRVVLGTGVYLNDTFEYERESARMLSAMLQPSDLKIDLEKFLDNYETAHDIKLSDRQREAVIKLMTHRALVVTGAPGTGKTTLVKTFVHLFRTLGVSHALMAPTGIAAKRLSNVTGAPASTIHRALKYDGFTWGVTETNPLEVGAVIVDELSMVDQELFYRLLSGLEPTTMLVLVGDDAQLPSVGPGNVLRELLACKDVPMVRLEHVFRQAETSDIVLAAHEIRKGGSPLNLPAKAQTEFRFLKVSDEAKISDMIVKLAITLKDKERGSFQVMSPKYEGAVGVNTLNDRLRDALNPDVGQDSYELLDTHIREGDRLMVVKNNYKLNVYNGDIGKLIHISPESLRLRIHGLGNTPDMEVDIPKTEADVMLKLAYAVTVHRCQGEEFETVILPLVKSQGRMLQRNLFYTAITRARGMVWLIGEEDAVLRAISNDKVVQRNTVLRDVISLGPQSSDA